MRLLRFVMLGTLKRRGRGGAETFRWCGYDWRDSLYLGLVSAEAKAAYSVHLWYVVSAGPSKTSERAQPGPKPVPSGIALSLFVYRGLDAIANFFNLLQNACRDIPIYIVVRFAFQDIQRKGSVGFF